MNNIIISYDLRHQRDYDKLIDTIKLLGFASRVLESLWYVKTDFSASDCINILKSHIDYDDGIAVFDCSNNRWATWCANHEMMQSLWQ